MEKGQIHYSFKKVAFLWLLPMSCFICSKAVIASGPNMIDFTKPSEQHHWQATNDNVMGGISTGSFIYDGQLSRFTGELSFANNGGSVQ